MCRWGGLPALPGGRVTWMVMASEGLGMGGVGAEPTNSTCGGGVVAFGSSM